MPVSHQEEQRINALVRRFEADTGIEAVAAVVGKADTYPEIPWKAYASGSALGGLAAVTLLLLASDWTSASAFAIGALATLGAGAAFAAAATLVPPFGRLYLDRIRARAEMRQYALCMFMEREIFRTRERKAVLLLVARYERAALVLADTGLAAHLPAADLERIGEAAQEALRTAGVTAAFEAGLTALRTALKAHGYVEAPAGRENALDDAVLAEKGP